MQASTTPPLNHNGLGAVAVTGSKGGVGKSNLVLNLAVALGKLGRRVLLVDGDLGLANLDVLMGLVPQYTVEHLIREECGLADVLIRGPEGVRLLPAASGLPALSRLDAAARSRMLSVLSEGVGLVDDVLVDTGAGLGEATLALQTAASRVLLVTSPEPTSLVNTYATLKVLWGTDPQRPVDLVVNAAVDDAEADQAYEQIAHAAQHFMGRELGWLGAVYRDSSLPEAVRRQTPLLELFPESPAARCYERIAERLVAASDGCVKPDELWRQLMPAVEAELPH